MLSGAGKVWERKSGCF